MEYQEVLFQLVDLFEKKKIVYFVTGSLAISYYGRPRASHDFDFMLAVKSYEQDDLISALTELGPDFSFDKDSVKEAVAKKTQADILYLPEALRINLWINKETPFDISRFKRRKKEKVFGKKIYFSSPEDIILIKLLWFKMSKSDRHLEDAASVYQIQQNLDHRYLSIWTNKLKISKDLKKLKTFPVQEW